MWKKPCRGRNESFPVGMGSLVAVDVAVYLSTHSYVLNITIIRSISQNT